MLRAFGEWRATSGLAVAGSVLAAGSHPLPDERSVRAAEDALALADEARRMDAPLVVLLSGGASAMMAAPLEGLSLDAKRAVTRHLLSAGVAIHELNAVRKHLSRIKGGRLALHTSCTTFALSDVVDDDAASIGSGPTVPDPSTLADARRVLDRTGLASEVPDVIAALERGGETPKPGDPRLSRSQFVLIGGRRTAMDGVVNAALARDAATIVLDEPITGDAAAAGSAFAERALAAARRIGGRVVVVASGETTVHVRGSGTGGRNQEFALGAAQAVAGRPADRAIPMAVAAIGTDGIDGNSSAAGAVVDGTTLQRARDAGLADPLAVLAANDTHPWFAALGDLIVTGPTGTNVGDVFVAIMDA